MKAGWTSAAIKGKCIWRWATNTERQEVFRKAGIDAKP